MAEFPNLPLFTDAYLGDTTHLTTQEHGAYLLLLIAMWRTKNCNLPNDHSLLARYCKLTPTKWKKISPIIMEFFSDDEDEKNKITQKKLKKTKLFVSEKSSKMSKNASARWLKNKEVGDAKAEQLQCNGNASKSKSKYKENNIKEIKPSNSRKGTKLQEDWKPSENDILYAKQKNWSDDEINNEIENFVEHFTNGNGRTQTSPDWSKRWQRWVRTNFAGNGKGQVSDVWAQRAQLYAEKKIWPEKWGPPPGNPGCKMPSGYLKNGG